MSEVVLGTRAVSNNYGLTAAVAGVSMTIGRGDIYGFVGRNGAGKTTLMRIVTGLVSKSGGEYELFGCPDQDAAILSARRRVGAIIETPALYPAFTAEQNLKMQCMTAGRGFAAVADVLRAVGLSGTGSMKVKNFSLGMRQRLGIAAALITEPEFLILDEPVNGLDPEGIVEVRELLLRLNRERGVTVLISSHILGELSKLATRFGFIERGRLLKEISAQDLEKECRRSVVLHMNGIARFAEAMQKLGVSEYRVLSQTSAEVFAERSISAFAAALSEVGLEIFRVSENEADLEKYFMQLIGGEER